MFRNSLYISLITCLFVAACAKKTPMPKDEPGDPVFYFSGKIDGVQQNFEAGNKEYYMHSSFDRSAAGYDIYKADLKAKCAAMPCGYSIAFLINDDMISDEDSASRVNSALHTGEYRYFDRSFTPKQQVVNFVPLVSESGIEVYKWTVKNTLTNTAAITAYSLSNSYDIGKTYSVTFNYDDGVGGCTTTHTNIFKIGNPFQTTIFMQKDVNPLTFKFYSHATGKAPYTYHWEFGDGQSSSEAVPVHSYLSDGVYIAKLLQVDASKDTCISYYQVSTPNSSACHANFRAHFMPINYSNVLKTITVVLTDPDGNVYTSDMLAQPYTSSANILSVSDYKNTDGGLPTKVLKISFNCMVSNGSKSIAISGAEAVVAVAYKN